MVCKAVLTEEVDSMVVKVAKVATELPAATEEAEEEAMAHLRAATVEAEEEAMAHLRAATVEAAAEEAAVVEEAKVAIKRACHRHKRFSENLIRTATER